MKCEKCGSMKFRSIASVTTSIHEVDRMDKDTKVICSNCGTERVRVGYEVRMTSIMQQLEQVGILMTWKDGFVEELAEIENKLEDFEKRITNLERNKA